MMEKNLKMVLKILHGQCTESLLTKLGGDRKYEVIKHYQEGFGMLKLINRVMFKLDGKKELSHTMQEVYMSVF